MQNIYQIETVQDEIKDFLQRGRKVYIESGAANDSIVSFREIRSKRYSWCDYEDVEIYFETSNCIFPKEINLKDYSSCDSEIYNDSLFVQVS